MGGSNFRGNFSMYQLHPRRFTPDPPHGAPTDTAPVGRGARGSSPTTPSASGAHVADCVAPAAPGTGPFRQQTFPEGASASCYTHTEQSLMCGYRQSGMTTARADHRDSQVPWSSTILRDVSNHVNYSGHCAPLPHAKESTSCYGNGTTTAQGGHRSNQVPWSSTIVRDANEWVNYNVKGTSLREYGGHPFGPQHRPETWGVSDLPASGLRQDRDYAAFPERPLQSGAKEVRCRGTDDGGFVVSHRNRSAQLRPMHSTATSPSNGRTRPTSSRSHRHCSAWDPPETKVGSIPGRGNMVSCSSESDRGRRTIHYPRPSSGQRQSVCFRSAAGGSRPPCERRAVVSGGSIFCSPDPRRVTGLEPGALQGGELAASMPDLRRETVVLSHSAPAKVSAALSLLRSWLSSLLAALGSLGLCLSVSGSVCLCVCVCVYVRACVCVHCKRFLGNY